MIRNHVKKVCYLMPLDPNRTPKELKDYMDKVSRVGTLQYSVVQDRTVKYRARLYEEWITLSSG